MVSLILFKIFKILGIVGVQLDQMRPLASSPTPYMAVGVGPAGPAFTGPRELSRITSRTGIVKGDTGNICSYGHNIINKQCLNK